MSKTSVLWRENWPPPCPTHDSKYCCSVCHPVMFRTPPDEGKLYGIEWRAIELLRHKDLYYNQGKSELHDHDYDRLEQSLRDLDPDHEVLQRVGSEIGE